jgi:hypothetical protein
MTNHQKLLPCDGCGLPASPEHIAQRVLRLELATKFRPVHIGVLFIVLAPPACEQNDFYGAAASKEFADPFLNALNIPAPANATAPESDAMAATSARLHEFQRRGFFLASVSECPIPEGAEPAAATIARLGPTLVRRIRFNYRPKHIAPMGQELFPLIEMLKDAAIAPILTLDQGQPLPSPGTGSRDWQELFQRAVSSVAPRESRPLGYGRIQLTQSESDRGAGGGT